MASYDYNYRPGYSTGNGAGSYTDQWGQTRRGSPPVVEPVGNYGYAAGGDKYRRPSSPPRQQVVEDFTTIVHSETIRDQPPRVGQYPNDVNRRQPIHTGYTGSTGYGDYNDYNNNTMYKPNGNTILNDNYDDYNNRGHGKHDNYDDYNNRKHGKHGSSTGGPLNMTSNGGYRAKPSRSSTMVGALPVRGDGRLSIPTDDMERALHYLKETARTPAWPRTK